MNKKIITLGLLFLLVVFFKSVSFAKEKNEEIKPIKGLGVTIEKLSLGVTDINEDNTFLSRFEEFNYFPESSFSLSAIKINSKGMSPIGFSISGSQLGEEDSSSKIGVTFSSLLAGNFSYNKIIHNIDLGVLTQRNNYTAHINLAPLAIVNFEINASEEDKQGNLPYSQTVGIKTKVQNYFSAIKLNNTYFGAEYQRQTVDESKTGNSSNSYLIFAKHKVGEFAKVNASFTNTILESANASVANIELKKVNAGVSYKKAENLSFLLTYKNTDLNNLASGKLSLNSTNYKVSSNYKFKSSNLCLAYTRKNKKLTNSQVGKQQSDIYEVALTSKVKKANLKASYKQELKNDKDILDTTVTNFVELPVNLKTASVLLNIFPRENILVYYNAGLTNNDYDLVSSYGVDSSRVLNQGAGLSYSFTPQITFNYNYFLQSLKLAGKRREEATDSAISYEVYQYGEYYQVGLDFVLGENTNAGINYWQNISDIGDLVEKNKVEEKEISANLNYVINKKSSVDVIIKQVKYSDFLSATTSGNSNFYELRYNTKF